jgi:hypothetical protein
MTSVTERDAGEAPSTWSRRLRLVGPGIVIAVTFVFGAAVTSTAALGVDAMFPNLLPVWAWAALHGILGFVIVGIGRYDLFERIMKVAPEYRNRLSMNILLAISVIPFIVVGVQEVLGALGG